MLNIQGSQCDAGLVLYVVICSLLYMWLPTASSGSVTINSDGSVQILAEEAAPLENFDMQVTLAGLLLGGGDHKSRSPDHAFSTM